MKFNCSKRSWDQKKEARMRALKLWHRYFAWFPVRIGRYNCCWLEFIQRKGKYICIYDFDHSRTSWLWRYKE